MEDNSVKGYVLTALINCGISQEKTKEIIAEIEMLLSEISPDQAALFYERISRRE